MQAQNPANSQSYSTQWPLNIRYSKPSSNIINSQQPPNNHVKKSTVGTNSQLELMPNLMPSTSSTQVKIPSPLQLAPCHQWILAPHLQLNLMFPVIATLRSLLFQLTSSLQSNLKQTPNLHPILQPQALSGTHQDAIPALKC